MIMKKNVLNVLHVVLSVLVLIVTTAVMVFLLSICSVVHAIFGSLSDLLDDVLLKYSHPYVYKVFKKNIG